MVASIAALVSASAAACPWALAQCLAVLVVLVLGHKCRWDHRAAVALAEELVEVDHIAR